MEGMFLCKPWICLKSTKSTICPFIAMHEKDVTMESC